MSDDHEVDEILTREVERRLGDVASRLEGAITRSSVVIGAAVVVAGLQSFGGHGWLRAIPAILALGAAVTAIFVLRHRDADEVPVAGLYGIRDQHTSTSMAEAVMGYKLTMIQEEENALKVQSRWLLASYLCLTAAIVVTVAGLVLITK